MSGAIVVDIGANVGSVSRSFLERIGSGCVYAIEPQAALCTSLRRIDGLTVIHAAVSDWEGETVLHHSEQTPHASLYPENVLASVGSSESVPMVTLDGLIARGQLPSRIDFVKVDAQGAETTILHGASQLLAQRHSAWYVELWPLGLQQAGSSLAELFAVLRAAALTPFEDHWDRLYAEANGQQGHASIDALFVPVKD